jgi:hypothetical protein
MSSGRVEVRSSGIVFAESIAEGVWPSYVPAMPAEFRFIEAERFFAEDMLAGAEAAITCAACR